MPINTLAVDNGEQLTINRRFILEARYRAQNEAWMWRYHSGTPRDGWRQHAACRGMDPNWWFTDEGSTAKAPQQLLTICHTCPVRLDCGRSAAHEEHTVDPNVIHGVRAGMSAQTRYRGYKRMLAAGIRKPSPPVKTVI